MNLQVIEGVILTRNFWLGVLYGVAATAIFTIAISSQESSAEINRKKEMDEIIREYRLYKERSRIVEEQRTLKAIKAWVRDSIE